jgi:Lrp/AsnC family transcriptional regulator, regulator for asnA, asnC and gidA
MVYRPADVSGELDEVDLGIMARLQEDGRSSNASIARSVGVSESTVKKRIDRLVDRGIMRVLAVVDPISFGHGEHMMAGINVRPGTATEVGGELAKMPEVAFIAYFLGRYDIWMEVFTPDKDTLLDFQSKRLAGIDHIVGIETFSVLRTQKVEYYNWSLQDGRVPGTPYAPAGGTDAG